MPQTAPPPGFHHIQHEELSRLFGRFAGARLAALPVLALLAVWVAVAEPARWRGVVLGALLVGATVFFLIEVRRYRRSGVGPSAIPGNVAAGVVAQVVLAAATGALGSPLLYPMIPLALVAGMAMPPPYLYASVGFQMLGVWIMAAVELSGSVPDLNLQAFGGGARTGWNDAHLLSTAVVLTGVLVIATTVGRKIKLTFDAMIRRALDAQQESLRVHAERAEELAALSGEIAHELKNPLASIKGLAGLLVQNVDAGKGAERLGVLRREVDRMQGILEEFLNFSRPIVPLALRRVDLGALLAEVAALHEGMAHDRGVRIERSGQSAVARCDPRKVKQILVNVVQNALEASSAGGVVELSAAPRPEGGIALRVADRGRGLEAGLGEKVFEPGVTTKDQGSGLGLTIARALARQHGGELTLGPREGGGMTVELILPPDAPARAVEEAAK